MCCGSRSAHKTGDAAARRILLEEDCEPLIEGGGEDVCDMEKRVVLGVTFPRHAAASFLRTGTSKAMREANYVL